jgi:broad specificity phosphatase PhoE
MKTIYFVRHGSTDGVENDTYQQLDTPLSPIGRVQAVKAAEYFKDIKIDLIITSTMTRASETAQIIKENAGLLADIQPTDLYHEAHRPTEVRGKSKFDPEVMKIIDETRNNFAKEDWKYSDEENFFDLKKRALAALEYASAQTSDTMLITTHATFLKILLAAMVFGDALIPDTMLLFTKKFSVENTSISKVKYKERRWRISSWNDHGHLLDNLE